MSLILDALQQAEQERRQGATAADLFTPPPPAAVPALTVPAAKRTGAWLLAALLLGAVAAGWWNTRDALTPKATAPAPAPSGNGVTPPPPPPSPPSDKALFTEPARANKPTAPEPAPPAAVPARAAAAAVPETPPTPPIAPATAPSGADLPTLGELPAQAKAALPPITITGHTYSDNPTLRSLMIDGRMFVEGQALAPGLRLERIGPHRAVFNLRGTRFGVDY